MNKTKQLSTRVLLLALVTALSVMAAGCQSGEGTSSGNNSPVSVEVVKPTDEMKIPDYDFKDGTIIRTVSTSDPGDMSEYYEKFKQLTGKSIKVETDVVSWAQLQSKLAVSISSGEPYDFFGVESVCTPWYIRKDLFQDISPYINMDDPLWKGLKDDTDRLNYKGVQYGVPDGEPFNMYSILYHTDLIEAAGLEDPRELFYKGEWTWDKFYEYAEVLTEYDAQGKVTVHGAALVSDFCIIFWGLSTGSDIITFAEDGTVQNNLSDPNWARSAAFIYKLCTSGYMPGLQYDWGEDFINGKVAMGYNQLWWSSSNEKLAQQFKDGGVSFAPTPKDPQSSDHYVYAWGTDSFICKGATNPEAAAAYLSVKRYLTLNPSQLDIDNTYKDQTENWGFSDEDIQLAYTDMQKLKMVYAFSTQLPSFEKKTTLWNDMSNTAWGTVVETVSPSLDEALAKINK